jgi:hypothetical protein
MIPWGLPHNWEARGTWSSCERAYDKRLNNVVYEAI